jgi:MFS family permease
MKSRASTLLAELFRVSPLRHAHYRRFYLGSLAAALAYTMQATTAAWLMATLTPSALMVALVQTASTAPALLFGLVAGALADIVDRRRIILVTQIVLGVATAALGAAELLGAIGPASLLAFTFLIGVGFAFYWPAQGASTNDLVARVDLARAVALGAVAFNVARAIGPALAGAIAAALGSGSALLVSAVFFGSVIVSLRGWKSPGRAIPGVPETLLSGIQSGLRYTRHSQPMRALILHNVSFTICASALWALLPVIARDQLGLGAGGYGVLSGFFGLGAVGGALLIPRGLHRTSLHTMVVASVVTWMVAAALIAWTAYAPLALAGACGCGAAWVGVLASLSAATQSAATAWVRARAVAMNLIASQVSMAAGSALWGALASWTDTRAALGASVGAMLVLLAINRRVRIEMGDEATVTPGVPMPDLAIAIEPRPDDGPVLIQLEYRIDGANRDEFLRAVHSIEPTRRRNGAVDWRVFRDLAEDGRFVERFVIQSWAEYVRLRTRMTMADRRLQDHIEALQRPGVPVRVSRLIGVDPLDAER